MKHLTIFSMAVIVLAVLTFSCSKDNFGSGNPGGETGELSATSISAKWDINNSSDFTSFEFNQSRTFIVVTNSGTETGSYSINGDEVVLENYGTMNVDSISGSYLSFKLTTNSNNVNGLHELIANKAAEMANSTNTGLLCRTWKLTDNDDGTVVNVLFSQAGTYFISQVTEGETYNNGTSYWAWSDGSENTFCYNHDQAANCSVDNSVQVSNLTSSTLTITEDGTEYFLVPVNSSRNIKYNTSNSNKNNPFSWIGY